MGPPPKPSGDSRGFGGESRSSGMSELSPPGGSEGYGACDDEGAAPCGRPRAHSVRPYGNTHHRRARPLGAPRADGDIGPYGQGRTICVGRDDPARRTFPLGGRWHLRSK